MATTEMLTLEMGMHHRWRFMRRRMIMMFGMIMLYKVSYSGKLDGSEISVKSRSAGKRKYDVGGQKGKTMTIFIGKRVPVVKQKSFVKRRFAGNRNTDHKLMIVAGDAFSCRRIWTCTL